MFILSVITYEMEITTLTRKITNKSRTIQDGIEKIVHLRNHIINQVSEKNYS